MTTLDPFKDASSVSHFSDNADVMGDSSGKGQGAQIYSYADMSVLKDLGYTVKFPVPEPESFALMGLGATAIGLAQGVRRIRNG